MVLVVCCFGLGGVVGVVGAAGLLFGVGGLFLLAVLGVWALAVAVSVLPWGLALYPSSCSSCNVAARLCHPKPPLIAPAGPQCVEVRGAKSGTGGG